jgi:hypothetical protein
VATLRPEWTASHGERLLDEADRAMYRAQEPGPQPGLRLTSVRGRFGTRCIGGLRGFPGALSRCGVGRTASGDSSCGRRMCYVGCVCQARRCYPCVRSGGRAPEVREACSGVS